MGVSAMNVARGGKLPTQWQSTHERFFTKRGQTAKRSHAHNSFARIEAILSVPSPGNPNVVVAPKSRAIKQKPSNSRAPIEYTTPAQSFMTLETEHGVSITLTRGGRLALLEKAADGTDRLVSQANLHLPAECADLQPNVVYQGSHEGKLVHCHLQWGPAATPLAELHIHAVPHCNDMDHCDPWSTDLNRGFVLDYKVSAASAPASGAEVVVHLEPSGYWFGGGHFIRQMWPLNDAALEVGPWYAFDNGPNGLNNLLGPHFMTSAGLLVAVDPDTPFLHVGMNAPVNPKRGWVPRKWGVGIQNAARELLPLTQAHGRVARAGSDGLLRVQSRANYQDTGMVHPLKDWMPQSSGEEDISPASNNIHEMLSVRVALCATPNAAEACKLALNTLIPPKQMPSADVLRAPIWTTWARYKSGVTQTKVLKYANEIVERDLQRSVMEIDDRWQCAYGDLSFDTKKFPDPVGMVDELHRLGFKVTTWVHPFVEEKSEAYIEGSAKGYFVGCDAASTAGKGGLLSWLSGRFRRGPPPVVPIAPGGSAPGFFAWWNTPPVAALDVTNPEAVEWFVGRLKELQRATGIDGFKFDAGEPCFLPRQPRTHTPLATPADYTRLYVEQVAGRFAGGVSEVRTGHMTQSTAVFTRMGDRFSTWDSANGLRSLIPTLLTSGLLGYPFCLPDMIGGNAYFGASPDAELMVRWAQANALMPAMQFSIAPWDLSQEAESLVASALQVRSRMEGLLLSLAEEAAHTLMPICRPLWMLAPGDEETFQIQDQFALGDQVIVAPVVHRGAKRRDVYLTEGFWRNASDGTRVMGGQWLRDVPTPLSHLPVFVREGAPGVQW